MPAISWEGARDSIYKMKTFVWQLERGHFYLSPLEGGFPERGEGPEVDPWFPVLMTAPRMVTSASVSPTPNSHLLWFFFLTIPLDKCQKSRVSRVRGWCQEKLAYWAVENKHPVSVFEISVEWDPLAHNSRVWKVNGSCSLTCTAEWTAPACYRKVLTLYIMHKEMYLAFSTPDGPA